MEITLDHRVNILRREHSMDTALLPRWGSTGNGVPYHPYHNGMGSHSIDYRIGRMILHLDSMHPHHLDNSNPPQQPDPDRGSSSSHHLDGIPHCPGSKLGDWDDDSSNIPDKHQHCNFHDT